MRLLNGAGIARRNIGDEHVGERRSVALGNLIALLGSTGDGDGRAVHVHLAVANLVEPGPREHIVASVDAFRNAELECVSTGAGWVFGQVPGGTGGAAALDGVDHHPLGAGRGRFVRGQGDLARAAAMHGRAGKGERLVDADGHDVADTRGIVGSRCACFHLAGKVATVGDEGRAVRMAKGCGRFHDHVRRGREEIGGREGDG